MKILPKNDESQKFRNVIFTTVVPREVEKKRLFCVFFVNIFLLVYVVLSRFFLLTQRARLIGPFRCLEYVRQANRKFSRGL